MAERELILIDLFSGVGGFALGLQRGGYKFDHHYYSEIEKNSIAVYKYKFKEGEYVGDVKIVSGRALRERHPGARFIVTFGFPCQDLSNAGKRKGLHGQRSGLFFQAIRIIQEIGDAVEVFIFENVEGLLSSNEGKDFEVVLRTIADLGIYECEWQHVNTAWILPQNRERVYFVGHFRGRSRPGVFPIRSTDKDFNEARSKSSDGLLVNCIDSNYHKGADGKRTVIAYQKTSGMVTTTKENMTGTLQAGGASVMDKVPNVMISNSGLGRKMEMRNIAPPLRANTGAGNNDYVFLTEPQHKHGDQRCYTNVAPTIQERYGTGGDNIPYVNNLRRLTERECERLQGFPDDWTAIGDYNGKIRKVSKTQRYKMMGNAVTVDMVEKIARRLICLRENNS